MVWGACVVGGGGLRAIHGSMRIAICFLACFVVQCAIGNGMYTRSQPRDFWNGQAGSTDAGKQRHRGRLDQPYVSTLVAVCVGGVT